MRRKVVLMLCLLLLCGCTFNRETLQNDLQQSLQDSSHQEAVTFTNMNKPLYSYYLPRDIGRVLSNDLSSVLKKDGTQFIMNFNPNAVVIHDYYYEVDYMFMEMNDTTLVSSDSNKIQYEGTFRNKNGQVHNYSCIVDELDNGKYFFILNMEYVYFYTIAEGAELSSLIDTMFDIGQSVTYDSEEIVSIYSLKSSSEYLTENLDEFTQDLPSEGYLSDLIGESE